MITNYERKSKRDQSDQLMYDERSVNYLKVICIHNFTVLKYQICMCRDAYTINLSPSISTRLNNPTMLDL